MKNKFLKGLLASFALAVSGAANAGLISLNEIVNTSTDNYTGGSAVFDGLSDAFDGYGRLSNFGLLDVSRDVFTLESIVTYGIFDTFTNNTSSSITTNLNYYVNLGSDGQPVVNYHDMFIHASNDNVDGSWSDGRDPAVSFLVGNNTWTSNNSFFTANGTYSNPEGYTWGYELTLEAGQSASLLNFATVYKDTYQPNANYDLNKAVGISAQLRDKTTGISLLNDYYAGALNYDGSITSITSVEVPEPSTLAVFALGLMGLASRKFKK